MGQVIGDVLPLALGVAVSPVPIIAAILMLLSPRARSTGTGFMIGWVVGIVVVLVVFVVLAAVIPQPDPDQAQPVAGVLKILFGAGILFLAFRQWRGRPQGDEQPALPKWMAAIDSMTGGKALGLGLLLSGLNPKNLLMAAGAGITIGSAGLSVGSIAVVVAIFTVIAACTVAGPIIACLKAGAAMAGPLDSLRSWLVHNNAVVMAVLLLVIGVTLIGKGIGSF